MAAAVLAVLVATRVGAVTVDQLPRGAVYTVTGVRVEGTERVQAGALKDAMLTKLPPWWKPWVRWRDEVTLNPELFRSDLERVQTFLREAGYYEATVAHDLELDGDEVTIVLTIDEGPAAELEEVTLAATDFSLEPATEEALRLLLPLEAGQVFTQEQYDEGRVQVLRFFLEQGYAYAEVAKQATVDTADARVRVTYTITRGPPAVFGTTTITGLDDVADRLVRREITWEAGAPYDPKKVEETQAQIFGLQLFRSVVVEPTNLEAKSGVVDLQIAVTEGPPREIKFGVGYGLEDELRGQLQWQHNDFFGGGRQLGVRLKGSTITQAIEGEFRQPRFLHPRQVAIVPLTQARQDEPGFTVTQARLAPRVERTFPTESLRLSLGYNVEYDELTDVPRSTIARLEEFEARGFVSSLIGTVERSTTVDLLDPRAGSLVNLTVEQAGGLWQGDFTFYRAVAEAKKYVPVLGERVLAGRLRAGVGDGFGQSRDLPMFRRFFAGGISSTRGYDRHLVGPLNPFGDPIGGRTLVEGNLELRTPVWRELGAVAFVDAGQVARDVFQFDPADLQFGVGAGVRYDTLVGPLRFDIGIPLDRPAGEPSWQIHFSIGQAF